MALENVVLVTINAATTGIAHGLTHGGVARTPHVGVIMPRSATAALATFGYVLFFDSITMTIVRGIATDHVADVFVKRCHTVEDITGSL